MFEQLRQAVARCQTRHVQENSAALRLHYQSQELSLASRQSALWSIASTVITATALTRVTLMTVTTLTTDSAITVRLTSALRGPAMVRNHTMATVILLRVLATHTLVLATSTKHSLVVQVYAMELDRAITATTLLALVTRIVEPAISTESTSVIMTTAMELRRPTIIAIMIMTTTTTITTLMINGDNKRPSSWCESGHCIS